MKPVETNILLGDCNLLLHNLLPNSIDLVLTDPPYNISRANGFKSMGRQGLDFGDWDKDQDILSYITMVSVVLKPGGSFIVFNDWKNLGDISKVSESVGLSTKDIIRLEKTNPFPRNTNRRYVCDYEFAVWFTKGKGWVFNKQNETPYLRPKFYAPTVKGEHPTQKNLKLIEDLIKIHSNEFDVVLDPFMGSGTTGVACAKLNRSFVGFELDEAYFKIAKRRINEACRDSD